MNPILVLYTNAHSHVCRLRCHIHWANRCFSPCFFECPPHVANNWPDDGPCLHRCRWQHAPVSTSTDLQGSGLRDLRLTWPGLHQIQRLKLPSLRHHECHSIPNQRNFESVDDPRASPPETLDDASDECVSPSESSLSSIRLFPKRRPLEKEIQPFQRMPK